MKQLKLSLIGLSALVITGCESSFVSFGDQETGEVALTLSTTDSFLASKPMTKADEPATITIPTPEEEAFTIEFKDSQDKILGTYKYSDLSGKTLEAPVGNYSLSAYHGDPDNAGIGSDYSYFSGSTEFEIKSTETTQVTLDAKMTKVMAFVSYGENLTGSSIYSEYYSVIKSADNSKSVTFAQGETDYGFIPAGSLIYELHVNQGETWKTFTAEAATYEGNTYLAYKVDINGESFTVNLSIVDAVESKTETITLKVLPTITFKGFDSDNSYTYAAGTEVPTLAAHIVADSKIANCILRINSDYLNTTLAIPAEIDMANLSEDVATKLAAAGLEWSPLNGQKYGLIDFTGMVNQYLTNVDTGTFQASFSLEVTDMVQEDQTQPASTVTSGTYTITVNKQ